MKRHLYRQTAKNNAQPRRPDRLIFQVVPAALFFLLLFGGGLFAAEEPWTDKFMREFTEIKTRLEKIQKRQQEISEKQDKIQAELDRLRIWVHKR